MTAALLPGLEDLGDIDGASVLVRADFNVPLRSGEIADDTRVRAGVPTIRWLRDRGASVAVCTHLGRPGGRPNPAWSVEPVRARLSQLVEGVGPAPVGTRLRDRAAVAASPAPVEARLSDRAKGVELLENLRFEPGEEADDPAFVDRLIEGCDFYVNDAFGVSHRPHASIMGPPRFLPSAAGRLLAREAEVLISLRNPLRRPFVAVLGGSKVSDKLGPIEALLEVVDTLVVGGAMCFTFLKAMGHEVGASLCEDAMVERCRSLLDSGADIRLPEDIVALGPGGRLGNPDAHEGRPGDSDAGGEVRHTGPDVGGAALGGGGGGHGLRGAVLGGGGVHSLRGEVRHTGPDLPDGWTGADIGPGSAAAFGDAIASAGTVFWNGPMGVFEDPRFAAGTSAVAAATADTRAFTVVGGGDSAAALSMLGLAGEVDHLSTGGGASLELIEKGDLCGLAALRGAPNAR